MTANVLIVEDESEFNDLLALYLRDEGVVVDQAYTAEEGEAFIAGREYDILLLDLNLPGRDGFEFLSVFKGKGATAQVMVISARDSDQDVIMALGYGADQYLSKPFSPATLVARVRAMLRRNGEAKKPNGEIVFGPYRLLPLAYSLLKNDASVHLSSREFEVLLYLARNAGVAFTPEKIYADVWGNRYGDITAVGTYIRRLRQKIEDDPASPKHIITVRGHGYRFENAKIL